MHSSYEVKVRSFEIITKSKTKLIMISFCQHPTALPKCTNLGSWEWQEAFAGLGRVWIGGSG